MVELTIGSEFQERNQEGKLQTVTFSDLQDRGGKIFALFFTANTWSCRDFKEVLLNFYTKINESKKVLEIITVSSDYCDIDWDITYGNLPWPAIPLNDKRIIPIKNELQVYGTPMVILLNNYSGKRCHSCRLDIETRGPIAQVLLEWIQLAGSEDQLEPSYRTGTESQHSEHQDLEEIEITTNILEEIALWKIKVREENILIRKSSHITNVKPLEKIQVWKIFEQFMEKKYESDIKLLRRKKRPQQLPTFMWKFLVSYNPNSAPGEAEKLCAQLLLSLKQLYEQKHPYGTIICRLLQIYHPDPIDLGLATFDIKARYSFEKMLKNFIKKQQVLTALKPTEFVKGLTYENEAFAEQGGYMPLIDVSDLIYTVFAEDRECGYRVMERLLPNNETKVEFTLFIVCWNMAKKGQQPKDLFKVLDKDGSGNVEINEFTVGIKQLLGVYLSDQEVQNVHKFMDADETGDIEYDEFMERISYLNKKYKDKNAWLCSKANILTGIADEYDQKRFRDFNTLQKLFQEADADNTGTLEYNEFEDFCIKIDKKLEKSTIQKMFDEAIHISKTKESNVMTAAAFAVVAMKNNIGGFGSGIFNAQKLVGLELGEQSEEEEEVSQAVTTNMQTLLLSKAAKVNK